ncbi:hypothetical protein Tco_0880210 [Tanacetum coccineum]
MAYSAEQRYEQNPSWQDHSRSGQWRDTDNPSPLAKWIEELQFPNGLKVLPTHRTGRMHGKGKSKKKEGPRQTDIQRQNRQALAVKAESVVEGKEEPILMIGVVNNPLKKKEPPRIMSVDEMRFPQYETGLQKASRKKFARWRSPLGEIGLRITVGEASHHRSDQITFLFKEKLIKLLRDNVDVFTWKYSDMTGIPRTLKIGDEIFVTEHKLNEDKKITSVHQKKRGMAPDQSAITLKEAKPGECALTSHKLIKPVQRTIIRYQKSIGRNMEAYVDDMVIKIMDEEDMSVDIKETFERLRKVNLKLNPKNAPLE